MANDDEARRGLNHLASFVSGHSSYYAARALGIIAPRVPARLGYATVGWLADVLYRRDNAMARGLRENIRHAMGAAASTDEVDGTARRAFTALLQNYFDLFRLPALQTQQLRALVRIEGWENITAARAMGRGLILLSAHMGNPEAGMQLISATDLPVIGPAEHVQPEKLYCYLVDLRTRHGLRLIPSDGPLLELFRALRRNEVVGLALDRDTTGSGVPVTLCGALARVPDGYAQLAAKLRVPLVPALCYRLANGQARLEVRKAFVPDANASRDEVYRAALDLGTRELERAITAHPDQWVLTTPLWIADC
jgi:KDO2-lipid IV(A) lauroyltransferase